MSTRSFILSVPSLDPIRDAIGSQNESLVEALVELNRKELEEEYGKNPDEDELEEIEEQQEECREQAEKMIMCETPPDKEPGAWNYLVTALIEHLKLKEFWKYPINQDWKHYYIWDPYRAEIYEEISPETNKLLMHLEKGRPFKGTGIDYDGCVFAWLTLEEVQSLHDALEPLDTSQFSEDYFQDFHEQLVETLAGIAGRKHELFLKAH